MAPESPDNTIRLWVKKTGVTGEHETLFRFMPGTTQVEGAAAAAAVLLAADGLVYTGDSWTSARWADAGSNISLPIAWTPIPGANGTTRDPQNDPFFLTFVGRSTAGRRVRWTIQGAVFMDDDNYRVNAGDNAGVADTIEAIRDNAPPITSIEATEILVYSYANVGFNAYFQRQARKT